MSRIAPLLSGIVLGAALAGGAVWFVTRGPLDEAQTGTLEAERRAIAAERENRDWERKLQAEYARGQSDREQIELLKARLATRRPAPGATADAAGGVDPQNPDGPPRRGHGGTRPEGPPPEDLTDDPLTWDHRRFRREFELLAATRRNARKSPRLPRIADHAKNTPDDAYTLMNEIFVNDLSASHQLAALLVMESAGDERGVDIIVRAWPKIRDAGMKQGRGPSSEIVRRAALRALAALPGDVQVDVLLEVWNHQPPQPKLRMAAMAGLAKRLHPVAIAAIEGTTEPKTPPALRARALESVLQRAMRVDYAEKDLIPLFAKALTTADGKGHVEYVLKAYEGFWDPACVAPLEAFASDSSQPAELTTRARRLADGIKSGKPRPVKASPKKEKKTGQAPDQPESKQPPTGEGE